MYMHVSYKLRLREVLLFQLIFSCGLCFDVHWNVPSQTCHPFGVFINVSTFGIIQNTDDVFYGDKVTIMYSAGKFPWLNNSHPINGGIPQNGNLTDHIETFKYQVNQKIPSNFKGVAILDFENYYPSYEMNLPEYKEVSRNWVLERHPDWSPEQVEEEAMRSFNNSAREFFEVLLWTGRELRPLAKWGYYHYPYCHNYGPKAKRCQTEVMDHNDEMEWLMRGSGAIYPSIYIFKNSGWSPRSRRRNAEVRIHEALRVKRKLGLKIPIYPYFWYRYHDDPAYLSPIDVTNTLGLAKVLNLEGIVIWGGSADLNSKEKCLTLQKYVNEQLGPLVVYIKRLGKHILEHVIDSRKLLKKLSKTAMREASFDILQ